jgi:putative lipoic acid-binding regulatory protein
MGSIEYFVDGLDELLFEGSGIHPLADETSQFGNTLGASTRRWGAVYATNGVISTSDMRYKKNVSPLNYGLKEIMRLETISYNWKDNTVGNTTIPEQYTKKKIGFSAQQLLEVIPEVVQTHSYTTSDEKGNYKRIKNEKLGVYYSDIIPVTVKAIQEQQDQVVSLQSEVDALKNELKLLKELILNKK